MSGLYFLHLQAWHRNHHQKQKKSRSQNEDGGLKEEVLLAIDHIVVESESVS